MVDVFSRFAYALPMKKKRLKIQVILTNDN